ncbi:MAG: transposase [bacterium]
MPTRVDVFSSARAGAHAEVAYLLLDGLRWPRRTHPEETVLCALGLAGDGRAIPLGLRVAAREDEHSWRALLGDLKANGIDDGVLLITCDGHPALMRAVKATYPETSVQISVSHELMALARRVDRRWRAACLAEARQIFAAPDRATAVARFRSWRDHWLKQGERGVSNLETHLAACLTFYRFSPSMWSRIRTVKLVERAFRQARQSALHVTSEEVRPLEVTVVAEQTLQAEIAPPVQPETGGTPAATPEPPVQESSAAEPVEVAPRPIEQETRPSSNGHADLAAAQSVNLGADADFMWWLGRHRRANARRSRILMAIAMSLMGLILGIALSWGF